MAGKKSTTGATGATVAANVARLREEQNLTFAELSRRLQAADNPIPELGLRNIEREKRKVDVDDLMALAYVLQVSPAHILMPHTPRPDDVHPVTAFGEHTAHDIWAWIQNGTLPMPDDDAEQFDASISSVTRSIPHFKRVEQARHIAEQLRREREDHLAADKGRDNGND